MMLVITAQFLLGYLRAASVDDSTLTGSPSPEWPPTPARVFQALVAGGGTGSASECVGGVLGLELLEGCPTIFANELDDVAVSPRQGRYVVVDSTHTGTVMDYPARQAQLVREGARMAPRDPVAAYVWPDVEASESELSALRSRAARVPYLGAADSPVRLTVSTSVPDKVAGLPQWVPSPDGDVALSVAYPGFLAVLDAAFERFSGSATAAGVPHRGAWVNREFSAYRSPGVHAREQTPEPTTIWLRFDNPISGRRVLDVTETLRKAVLEHADMIAGGRENVPEVLHGHHGAADKGFEHVRFLALPYVGSPHADGRIYGACVWLPPGTAAADIALARSAVGRIRRLVSSGGIDVAVSGFDGTRAPWSSNPGRWVGPAKVWVSVFPVVHERWVKRGLTVEEVSRWCGFAGLPEIVAFRSERTPLLHGGVALTPDAANRGERCRPYSHFEIEFAEPVRGPVAFGRGRHFGLGLCAPLRSRGGDRA